MKRSVVKNHIIKGKETVDVLYFYPYSGMNKKQTQRMKYVLILMREFSALNVKRTSF
jgi:hypothetical protein